MTELLISVFLPFIGTTLGASGALFMKSNIHPMVRRSLAGFAGGVMVAASVWSLLLPALEQSEPMGRLAFAPAAIYVAVQTPPNLHILPLFRHLSLFHSKVRLLSILPNALNLPSLLYDRHVLKHRRHVLSKETYVPVFENLQALHYHQQLFVP